MGHFPNKPPSVEALLAPARELGERGVLVGVDVERRREARRGDAHREQPVPVDGLGALAGLLL